MKLVAFFVPGDVAAATAVVNKLNLTYEFAQMLPGLGADPNSMNPFERGFGAKGHHVIVRVTDQRVNWLNNHLKELGL